ncbi:RIP metalloprotease RseP [Blattabacterium cuenoti]|uniref:RIP metalloprotease RseP n=1 Tax=Blattabacterium cuenoti TaxID=1653831 RepID=UPI00163CDCBA|nr:RIP metalloprotease RseP [Blattabacterium cuenoti]
MIEILVKTIQMLLCLSILVIIHELGHFAFSKMFKVHVEKFMLFFDPWFTIYKKKIGNTIYGIGWLPLGGYVKIYGMNRENQNQKVKIKHNNGFSNTKIANNNIKFYYKSAIKRLLIVSGGIIFNVLLSILIFSGLLFLYGEIKLPTNNLKYGIEFDSLGKQIGFKNGDKILFINDKVIPYFNDISKEILLGKDITIDRMGKIIHVLLKNEQKKMIFDKKEFIIKPRVPPIINDVVKNSLAYKCGLKKNDEILSINSDIVLFSDQIKDILYKNKNKLISILLNRKQQLIKTTCFLNKQGIIGIYLKSFIDMDNIFVFEKHKYSILGSIYHGTIRTFMVLKNQILFFKNVFYIKTKAYKQLGSFFSIAKELPSEWNWEIFWVLTGTLSIWLAFVNFFPIPSLDGGYILFIILEIITNKTISEKFIEKSNIIGFIIISFIMFIMIIWDILKVFFY